MVLAFACASPAWALGPTSTDWRDATGNCGPADSKAGTGFWTPVRLNAVHGRSRPNGGTVVTNRDIWAVGDSGNIIYYNGTSWAQQASPTSEKLRAVYIYPTNISVTRSWTGTEQIAGWAVGDHGTVLKLTENTPGTYVWSCENCPADCGPPIAAPPPTRGAQLNLCATLYDIFPSDHRTSNGPVFFTGMAQCQWYPDNSCFTTFGDAPTLYYFTSTMTGWAEIASVSSCPASANPYYLADATWINAYKCTNGVSFTGIVTQNTGSWGVKGGIMDSGYLRFSTGLDGNMWMPFSARFTTSGCTYEPAYYTSALFGKWAVVMGDAAGACWNHNSPTGAAVNATNMFIYNQFSGGNPVFALRSGLSAAMDATWGTVKKLASLDAWGFGIGVGHGAPAGADVDMDRNGTATDSYFALVKWTDNNKLVAPEDPTSPNSVLYQQDPIGAGLCAGSKWPGMNGVFISAYNEAWAVGENGKILHWTGPIVTPAKLECALSVSPSGAIPTGTWFDVVLTVTNTGEAGLANLAYDLIINPPSGAKIMCGPFTGTIWYDGTNCAILQASPLATSLPPGGPAYFTWTFSMSGCGTGISFTASVSGLDLLNTEGKYTSTMYVIGSQPLALSVTTWHIPAAVTAGSPMVFHIVATNLSSATAYNPVVVDTIPAGLIGVVLEGPPGFVTGMVNGTAYWDGTGTATIPPGVSMTFTVTGTIAASCAAVPVTTRGWARADDGCGTMVQAASGPDSFTVPALTPAALTVTVWHVPAAPGPGMDVAYTITVRNTGAATITSLTVVETMPSALANVVAGPPPPGFGFLPGWASGSTIFLWGAASISMLPGTSYTFTATAFVPSACATGSASTRGWANGGTGCTSVQVASGIDSFPVSAMNLPVFTVGVTPSNPAPVAGENITYTILVTNTGAATITDLTVVDTMPGLFVAPTEGVTPVPFTFSASGRVFSWKASGLTFFPGTSLAFGASGYVPSACAGASMSNLAMARALTPCGSYPVVSPVNTFPIPGQIDGSLAVESQQEVPGRYLLTVTLTITDTGSSWLNRIFPSPDLVISPAGPETVKVNGPYPTGFTDSLAWIPTCTMVNPCSVSFRWLYRSTTVTPITITAVATGEICPPPLFSNSSTGCVAQGGTQCTFTAVTTTFFNESGAPAEFSLNRNLFRGRTEKLTVTFTMAETTQVSVIVYNSVGQRVRTLCNKVVGRRMEQSYEWDGINDAGERCASGAYFVRLETPHYVKTKKVALVK